MPHDPAVRRGCESDRISRGVALFQRVVVLATFALAACTTVGVHTPQRFQAGYGAHTQMRVCVLQAPGVTRKRVDTLIAEVNREFAPYAIEVVVQSVQPWKRPSFTHDGMMEDLIRRELDPSCDRLVAFVDRNAADFLWSLVMPEVLGAVDDTTHTRGYIVANQVTLNQLFQSPGETAVHEFYHLLGCPHARTLQNCYGRIAALKRQFVAGADFFPSVGADGKPLLTRQAVEAALHGGIIAQAESAPAP